MGGDNICVSCTIYSRDNMYILRQRIYIYVLRQREYMHIMLERICIFYNIEYMYIMSERICIFYNREYMYIMSERTCIFYNREYIYIMSERICIFYIAHMYVYITIYITLISQLGQYTHKIHVSYRWNNTWHTYIL